MAPRPPGNKGKEKATETHLPDDDGILDDIPAPCATFDLDDTENLEKNYTAFVDKLIQTMKEETDVQFNFTKQCVTPGLKDAKEVKKCVPVTPGLDYTPHGIFSFDLVIHGTHLRLVCDKYQFWFRGIVTADGTRYEIDEPIHPKVMRGSRSLYTNGMYPKLLGGASVSVCKVGYQSFRRSVAELAKLGRSGQDLGTSYRSAIATILVMCFEAARIKKVFDFCLGLMKAGEEKDVGEENKILINSWSDTCRDFYEQNRDTEEILISPATRAEISRVYEGVRILCRSRWDRWIERNAPTPKKQSTVRKG